MTGKIVCPTLEQTRTEPEFVAHITRTVDTDPEGEWVFVVDCFNTHLSESLVNFVAARCDLGVELGKKTKAAFSNRWPHARNSSPMSTIGFDSFTYPSTVLG